MSDNNTEARLNRLEGQIDILLRQQKPPPEPESLWKRLASLDTLKNLLYLLGLPVTIVLAYQAFDREILNAQKARDLDQKNLAIERLDQLQDINAELYRLQSGGAGDTAFAIIEAKRGRIARLTDAVHSAWAEQPDMLGRYDLNALAEALLVQKRTDDAIAVAEAVDVQGFTPIEQIDQMILKARIRFEQGPAHDPGAARQHLRDALAIVPQVERAGQQFEMSEKILFVRLVNEAWLNTGCDQLIPLADGLRSVHADNLAAGGGYRDRLGVKDALALIDLKCD